MNSGSVPRRSPHRSGSAHGTGASGCGLSARAHLTCGVVGLLVTLGVSIVTFALVVSLTQGLGVLSTTAVVLGFAGLWTLAWITIEVGLLRWGDRLPLSVVTTNAGNGDP